MAEEKAARRRLPYKIASISGVVISVLGAGVLVAIIATGKADPNPSTAVGPGWSAMGATLAIIGFSTAVVSKLGWVLVDTRNEVREVHALLATRSLKAAPEQRAPAKQQPAQQGKRQRSRRGRGQQHAQGDEPKESANGWQPGDERYMDDVAKAVRLGQTLPRPAEPA